MPQATLTPYDTRSLPARSSGRPRIEIATDVIPESLLSGLVGAVALTVVHQVMRNMAPKEAPRLNVFGRKIIKRGMKAAHHRPPGPAKLERWALVGDLAANTAYYSLIGMFWPKTPLLGGTFLGSIAGALALVLPPFMQLPARASSKDLPRKTMTVGWFLIGGWAAAFTFDWLRKRRGGG